MDYIKQIIGYEGLYSITNDGIVISHGGKSNHKKDITMSLNLDKDGYKRVGLQKNKQKKYFRVCRLVALHFVNNENKDLFNIVNHIDKNKNNDSYLNLEWVDQYKNWKHSESDMINKEQCVIKLDLNGNFLTEYKSLMDAARYNNINQGNISNCLKGRCKSVGGFKWSIK